MDGSPKTPKSVKSTPRGAIDVLAAQCGKCFKWRVIPSPEEYEDIRSKFEEEPFFCDSKPDVSCDDPADIDYDSSRTWVIDKPNIPMTPPGFKRILVLRRDYSKLDTHYITPEGKKVRSRTEAGSYLQANPKYKDLSISDFVFTPPKVMEDTIPVDSLKRVAKKTKTSTEIKEEIE